MRAGCRAISNIFVRFIHKSSTAITTQTLNHTHVSQPAMDRLEDAEGVLAEAEEVEFDAAMSQSTQKHVNEVMVRGALNF